MGKVLARILSDFMGLKSQGKTTQGIEISNESLKSELDLDIDLILSLKNEELSAYLTERKLTSEHIEMLADYLAEIGEHAMSTDKQYAMKILEQTLELYNVADAISNTYSFDRISKKDKIKASLAARSSS